MTTDSILIILLISLGLYSLVLTIKNIIRKNLIKSVILFLISIGIFVVLSFIIMAIIFSEIFINGPPVDDYTYTNPKTIQDVPSKYSNCNGINIHYKACGTEPYNLVFIHGWGCDVNAWREQMTFFENKARCIFIDLPGYGKSDKPHIDYTLDFFAESIKCVLDELKIENPILVSHSLGTPICRQLIKKYPELNAMLCDVDGVYCLFPNDSLQRINYAAELNAFASAFNDTNYNNNVQEFIHSLFYKTTTDTVKNYALAVMSKTPQYVGSNTMKYLIQEHYWDNTVINVPTLVIYSKNSDILPDYEYFIRELYSNMKYYELDSIGHFIMMEDAHKFNGLLWHFIKNREK